MRGKNTGISSLASCRVNPAFNTFHDRRETPAVALLTETSRFGHNNFTRDDIMFMVEKKYKHKP